MFKDKIRFQIMMYKCVVLTVLAVLSHGAEYDVGYGGAAVGDGGAMTDGGDAGGVITSWIDEIVAGEATGIQTQIDKVGKFSI